MIPIPSFPARLATTAGLCALLVLTVAACGGSSVPAAGASTHEVAPVAPAPSPQATGSSPTAARADWPLTGMTASAAGAAAPILLVKVENDPAARPQWGLEQADIVVEELVEGGITRFAALYQSRLPATIGPVRSVRHVDADLAAPVADVFAYSGGAAVTLAYLASELASLPRVTEGAPGFFRDTSRLPPRNLFLHPARLLAGEPVTAARGRTLVSAPFAPAAQASAVGTTPASSLVLRFSPTEQSSWTHTTGGWVRSEAGVPAISASGVRLTAQNVLVLRVQTTDAGYQDPAGHFVPETLLTGTGDGLLLRAASTLDVTWSKSAVDQPIVLTSATGSPVTLLPGTTWVELLPTSGSLTVR
jgi:Protein of unknown function (DUF3048) N-terminal domain/Protein of unknown function (DUF3048) C-terminal domain